MNIRIAGVVPESMVDGEGIRYTIFTQGCPHHCRGCHNPQTHDPSGGSLTTTEQIIHDLRQTVADDPLISGLTLSGGEPFAQAAACAEIARAAHDLGLTVWCWTGYYIDNLPDGADQLLREVDVLVDGPFEIDKRSLELDWRGSSNQRVLKIKP